MFTNLRLDRLQGRLPIDVVSTCKSHADNKSELLYALRSFNSIRRFLKPEPKYPHALYPKDTRNPVSWKFVGTIQHPITTLSTDEDLIALANGIFQRPNRRRFSLRDTLVVEFTSTRKEGWDNGVTNYVAGWDTSESRMEAVELERLVDNRLLLAIANHCWGWSDAPYAGSSHVSVHVHYDVTLGFYARLA